MKNCIPTWGLMSGYWGSAGNPSRHFVGFARIKKVLKEKKNANTFWLFGP